METFTRKIQKADLLKLLLLMWLSYYSLLPALVKFHGLQNYLRQGKSQDSRSRKPHLLLPSFPLETEQKETKDCEQNIKKT